MRINLGKASAELFVEVGQWLTHYIGPAEENKTWFWEYDHHFNDGVRIYKNCKEASFAMMKFNVDY